MPRKNKLNTRKTNVNTENLLKEIGIENRLRDRETMRKLMESIEHPSQLAHSPYLSEEDPLRLAAIGVLEDFETVTNGMERNSIDSSAGLPDSPDPLKPWRLLTAAAEAFYSDDIPRMMQLVRAIPPGTAPARLTDSFEILAGKPELNHPRNAFAERLRSRSRDLVDGLELLSEAATYPDILMMETRRLLPALARENVESATRLCLWAMETIGAERPLTEEDAAMASTLGPGEAHRLLAIASLIHDPDRSIIYWLNSLKDLTETTEPAPGEIVARLSIAYEFCRIAQEEGMMTLELSSAALDILSETFLKFTSILPNLTPLPRNPSELTEWLKKTGLMHLPETRCAVNKNQPELSPMTRSAKRQSRNDGMLLFEGLVHDC